MIETRTHANVVQPVKVWQRLRVRLELDKLLRPAVQQANVRVRAQHLLAIQLQDHTEHTVSSGMLGTEVDREVAHLAAPALALRECLLDRKVVEVLDGVEVGGLVGGGGLDIGLGEQGGVGWLWSG